MPHFIARMEIGSTFDIIIQSVKILDVFNYSDINNQESNTSEGNVIVRKDRRIIRTERILDWINRLFKD
jgi:hypothetical protein